MEDNAYITADINISPSPLNFILISKLAPFKLMITTPIKPMVHPSIFLNVRFSCFNIKEGINIAKKTFEASIMEALTPVVFASPR